MFLVDTNIFLSILLGEKKSKKCKKFLEDNIGELNITDFSLHSIGVILFRNNKENIFKEFIEDILPNLNILSLPLEAYNEVIDAKIRFNLDFDDAYQYSVAKVYNLAIVTMDRHFKKVERARVQFL